MSGQRTPAPPQGAPALWDHQLKAAEAAVGALAGGGRATVVMACGTGKTRTAAQVSARLAPHGRVLVVVPTLDLLAQTAREWAKFLGAGVGRLVAVCSDASATQQARASAELAHLEALVTTDPARLAQALERPGRATVMATYASLHTLQDHHRRHGGAPWDLAVVDEAHRAVGDRRRPWSAINHDAQIPAARRLYMTATPRIYDASGAEADVVGMDEQAVFGPEVFRLDFARAIDMGMLCDYRVLAAVVSDAEVARLTAGQDHLDLGGRAVPAAMAAAQIALGKAIAAYDLRRVITFHHRVLSAKRFAAALPEALALLPGAERPERPVRAFHLSGASTAQARQVVLGHLADPGGAAHVVSNARLLGEGVDVPELDAVMFADPRSSQVDVVQAVGRALRRGRGAGKTATVIIPVLLAEGESPEAALEGSAFDVVWRVVRALRAHDERMAAYLDTRRAQLWNPDHEEHAPQKLPDWFQVSAGSVPEGFAAAVHLRMVTATTNRWPEALAAARAFHERHGHLRVPHRHREGDLPLDTWLNHARTLYRKGGLPAEHTAALEEMGMVWAPHEGSFNRGLERLQVFREANGHAQVPIKYVDEEGFRLGAWLSNQRTRWRNGTLPADRATALERLGASADQSEWGRLLAAARAFHERHGHLRVPKKHVEDDVRLGERLMALRTQYRKGELPAERIAALEDLGMVWNMRTTWEEALQACRAFYAEHGHLRAPSKTVINGIDLTSWIQNRRAEYRRGTLAAERIAALEEVGMVWSVYEQEWRDGLEDLREFHDRFGHTIVPRGYRGDRIRALAAWIQRRRAEHSRGELAPERVAELAAISPDWHVPGQAGGRTRAEIAQRRAAGLTALRTRKGAGHR